jgi:putative spermidine/putrescine transport system substrate-binding protein
MISRRGALLTFGSATALAATGWRKALAGASQVFFVSWGGTTQDAQTKAWGVPFGAKTGTNVVQTGPTDYGKLKAMVDARNVSWDVVDVEHDFGVYAGKIGLAEPLDFAVINKSELDPRFVTDYAVGSFVSTHVLGFDKSKFSGETPSHWPDLFNLAKFPGKRAYYKWVGPGLLEVPLLADGVKPSELYPFDLDRAFKKLDTIKKNIVWYSSGAESQQLLASGETPVGMFWSGRLYSLLKDGMGVGISWNQNLVAADLLLVPKGAPDKQAAMKFLAYAVSAEGQAAMANMSGYGPVNTKSIALLDPDILKFQPSEHAEQNVPINIEYWAENRENISKRWYEWQSS